MTFYVSRPVLLRPAFTTWPLPPQQHGFVSGGLQALEPLTVAGAVKSLGIRQSTPSRRHPSLVSSQQPQPSCQTQRDVAPKIRPPAESYKPRAGSSVVVSEASTAASTPSHSLGSSPGLSPNWSYCSSVPPSPNSQVSSPGRSRKGSLLPPVQPVETRTAEALGKVLGTQGLVDCLRSSGNASQDVFVALAALGEQAVRMGIDYRSLGHSWEHPKTRLQYRLAQHPSTTCLASRQRAEISKQRLQNIVVSIANGLSNAEVDVVETFLVEIGVPATSAVASSASFSGVLAALNAELLLPLRALQEGQHYMCQTYSRQAVPADLMAKAVQEVIMATLSKPGGLSEWRYSNSVGAEQLRGLSSCQLDKWKEPTSLVHASGLNTHEDVEGELGFFWATKIGGPSHGFDFEGQCHLPLLANARSKALLVNDPAWPTYPAGRAYLRLLWTAAQGAAPEARLWLEAVNIDFDAGSGAVDSEGIARAVLCHALVKAEAMGIPLSVASELANKLVTAAAEVGGKGIASITTECLALRPSNGVCEASDSLCRKHDWVQLQEEVLDPIERALYVPASCKARSIEQFIGNL